MFASLSRRFISDRRGNVAIIFAMLLLPVLGMIGAAIDYKRAVDARTKISAALDGALLALARDPNVGQNAALQFLNDFLSAQLQELGFSGNWSITSFHQTGNRITADIGGSLPTTLMGLLGVEQVSFETSTTVVREQKKVELALVLDNTGSMSGNGRIASLRNAATALVNIMTDGINADENVKIALVPFVTAVNIKAAAGFSMSWMDNDGEAEYHGVNFDETIGADDGDGGGGGGGDDDTIGWWGGGWGGGGGGGDDGPEPVSENHFELFDAIPNATWKGCVEARAEPYDVDDTVPNAAMPDTLWVPWFWPDEPDSGSFANNYLNDRISGDRATRQKFTGKYNGFNASIDESPSNTSGPNKACGQPLRPLTNNWASLLDDISQMQPWNGSGTNIAQGLAWGWRVLSPTEPFTEGVPYEDDETLKALVLLSDGENVVVSQNNSLNYSDYNPYNYLAKGRLNTVSSNTAAQRVNEKVAVLCNRIKDKGVRVYTILFDLNSSSLRTLFRNCASEPALYFDNPSPLQLQDVFEEIAYDLSKLRIEK